jgi:hypothetical protein
MNPWGRAWVALTLALAVHVADEAAGGFLEFYNPVAQSVRDRLGLPFPPEFDLATWLGGLILVVVLLLALSVGTTRGWRWMRPASYGFAVVMIANGLGHIAASTLSGILIPGTLSSPLILAAAGWLIYATRPPARHESPGGSA